MTEPTKSDAELFEEHFGNSDLSFEHAISIRRNYLNEKYKVKIMFKLRCELFPNYVPEGKSYFYLGDYRTTSLDEMERALKLKSFL